MLRGIPFYASLAVVSAILIGPVKWVVDEYQTTKRQLSRYEERAKLHHRNKQGCTTLSWSSEDTLVVGDEGVCYNLRSFDGGATWVAMEFNDDWGMKALGLAEDVYPGLLDDIEKTDALISSAIPIR